MFDFLNTRFDMPPTDRISQAFVEHGASDPGGRALGAYDEFLGLLDDGRASAAGQQAAEVGWLRGELGVEDELAA